MTNSYFEIKHEYIKKKLFNVECLFHMENIKIIDS